MANVGLQNYKSNQEGQVKQDLMDRDVKIEVEQMSNSVKNLRITQ